MLTQDEIEAIRTQVADEPEASPARQLLAHLDAVMEAAKKRSLSETKKFLVQDERLTEAEAEAVLAGIEQGWGVQYGEGPCRVCKGRGRVTVPQCMGVKTERCSRCYGKGRMSHIIAPTAPTTPDV